ncbi:MAG: hypothetical protein RR346_06585 [Bacteroidales bacterium]
MKTMYLLICLLYPFFIKAEKAPRTDLWKHGLKGPVQSCRTVCYCQSQQADGAGGLEKCLLEYAGDAYDVNSHYLYDSRGFIAEEKNIPVLPDEKEQRRVYDRDESCRIIQIRIYSAGASHRDPERLKYEYDTAGRVVAVNRYDRRGRFIETVEEYSYNDSGYRVICWKEDEISYKAVLNQDEKCVEEQGILPTGKEFYHNYHQYDPVTGKRLRTTFTVDKKIIEVRDNPYSDNILDDGEILTTDHIGNWITKSFSSGGDSDVVVVREIIYYP